jgi:hypothetical protein
VGFRRSGLDTAADYSIRREYRELHSTWRLTRLHRPRAAQAEIRQYFLTRPSVQQMVLTLEAGFAGRQPGVARSIEVLVDPKILPELL